MCAEQKMKAILNSCAGTSVRLAVSRLLDIITSHNIRTRTIACPTPNRGGWAYLMLTHPIRHVLLKLQGACNRRLHQKKKFDYPGVIGGHYPGILFLDEIKIGWKPHRTIILRARSQTIPRPTPGIRDGIEKDGVSLGTPLYSTLKFKAVFVLS